MTRWKEVREELEKNPRTWLVTGAAGFIGSHLVQELLNLGQEVRALDDFSTGSRANLADVERRVGPEAVRRFELIEGDVRDPATCAAACAGVKFALHQAALGSVPRSIAEPVLSHAVNVTGFLNVLEAARSAGCERFVYASSSSVYGDEPTLPKREDGIGQLLSPYAATKRIDEVYANTYRIVYAQPVVGLRYFNVFGPRQDPNGPYAAVIPKWIETFLRGEVPTIYGDGETSRDFCPVSNVVQANVLAAFAPEAALGRAFNVGLGKQTSLTELFFLIRDGLAALDVDCGGAEPTYEDFRAGDVKHSLASLDEVCAGLGYSADVEMRAGLDQTLRWYLEENPRAGVVHG